MLPPAGHPKQYVLRSVSNSMFGVQRIRNFIRQSVVREPITLETFLRDSDRALQRSPQICSYDKQST